MDNNPAFDSIRLLAQNRRAVFIGIVVGSISYGMHVCIFSAAIYFMHLARRKRAMPLWPFVYMGTLFTLGTLEMVGTLRNEEIALIGDSEEIPLRDLVAQDVMSWYGFLVAVVLQDGILIYRVFVVWNQSWFAIVIPIITLLISTALSFYSGMGLGAPDPTFSTAFYALSMTLNIALTAMIVGRMLYLRQRAIKVLGNYHAKIYSSVSTIFLESGILYTSFGLAYLIASAFRNEATYVLMQVLGQVVCIAPELIVFHVARGRAWTRDMSVINFSRHEARNSSPTSAASDLELSIDVRDVGSFPVSNLGDYTTEDRKLLGNGTKEDSPGSHPSLSSKGGVTDTDTVN